MNILKYNHDDDNYYYFNENLYCMKTRKMIDKNHVSFDGDVYYFKISDINLINELSNMCDNIDNKNKDENFNISMININSLQIALDNEKFKKIDKKDLDDKILFDTRNKYLQDNKVSIKDEPNKYKIKINPNENLDNIFNSDILINKNILYVICKIVENKKYYTTISTFDYIDLFKDHHKDNYKIIYWDLKHKYLGKNNKEINIFNL